MHECLFDPYLLRSRFPSLQQRFGDHSAIFFDSPGGTQVPDSVIDAVSRYYREQNANAGGAFETSRRTDAVVQAAREAMADFLCAPEPETIVFGPNMTSLTFHLARSIADTIRPGDEIVVTNLDHDANVTPWTDLAAAGAVIKMVDFRVEDCTLDLDSLRIALSDRTRLVAVTHASNAVGTIPPINEIIRLAHQAGALVYVDAVQYAPHGPIDVQQLDCDFLACSAYKFFGPHAGALYGKRDLLERIAPHKVRPALDSIPWRWETGTQNHEALAGICAAVGYLSEIGERFGTPYRDSLVTSGYSGRRNTLKCAMHAITEYERRLTERLLSGLAEFDDLTVHGITDPSRFEERLPVVAFTWKRLPPSATAERLGRHGICCWSGNYYALRLMERLGLQSSGGAVRIGLAHYSTEQEVETLLDVMRTVA